MAIDQRKWYQKFVDQTMLGPSYRVYLTPSQAETALSGLSGKKGWRISTLINKLEEGLGSPITVGGNEVVALSDVGTSDVLILKEFIDIRKSNVREYSQL